MAWRSGRAYFRMGSKQKPRDYLSRKREALKQRDGDRCFYCGKLMFWKEAGERIEGSDNYQAIDKEDCTLEHLVARAKGGPDHMDNLVLVHDACNKLVDNLPLIEKLKIRERNIYGQRP